MYGHMHSTSTTSTVQLLETLGRRQSAMSKKQEVVHIHSNTCRPVKADCRARMWGVWVYRGCSHLMKWSRSAVSRLLWICSCPTVRGPRWWQLEQAQHTGSQSFFFVHHRHGSPSSMRIYVSVCVCMCMSELWKLSPTHKLPRSNYQQMLFF